MKSQKTVGMTIDEFNELEDLCDLLKTTCGSERWVTSVASHVPFESVDELLRVAEQTWKKCEQGDWLEAFKYHPEIGNIESLRNKYSQGKNLSISEQSVIQVAGENTLKALAKQNKAYKEKFGFIFIVFASGKSANQMLALLNDRIDNTLEEEMQNAMEEQWKITKLRLKNLFA